MQRARSCLAASRLHREPLLPALLEPGSVIAACILQYAWLQDDTGSPGAPCCVHSRLSSVTQ
jgi:hypothetical protein